MMPLLLIASAAKADCLGAPDGAFHPLGSLSQTTIECREKHDGQEFFNLQVRLQAANGTERLQSLLECENGIDVKAVVAKDRVVISWRSIRYDDDFSTVTTFALDPAGLGLRLESKELFDHV